MQIDFHHGVTYVVSRLAGFDHADAETIAKKLTDAGAKAELK